MKKILYLFVSGILGVVILTACNRSYARELKKEKKLIKEYIKRNHINILDSVPADGVWGEKDYIEIDDDNLYFHLSDAGDTDGDTLRLYDNIVMRYRKYTLDIPSDTISFWTTNDTGWPVQFQYGVTAANTCPAWHTVMKYMKYSNSKATIICPSKLGFDDDGTTVTPFGYDIHIKIKKF